MKRKGKNKSGCGHTHETQLSRREFLAGAGSAGVSFSIANPLLWGLLKSETAKAEGALSDLRFLHLQLSGGGAGSRHGGLPLDAGGNIVPQSLFPRHYGYPANLLDISGGTIAIGGVPFARFLSDGVTYASGFTKGLMTEILKDADSANLLANLCTVQLANISQNDNTPARMAGISTFYSKSLALANLRPKCADVIGLTNSVSGNGTGVKVANGAMTRITATSVGQLRNLKSFSQALSAQGATQTQLESFAAGLKSYLTAKTKRLGQSPGENIFSEIQNTAAADLLARVVPDPLLNSNALDVTQNPTALGIFGLTAGNFNASNNAILYTALYGVIKAQTSPILAHAFGGHDYHGVVADGPDLTDERAGRHLGITLRLAWAFNVPIAVYITSDGSVGATGATGDLTGTTTPRWSGDNSNYGQDLFVVLKRGSIAGINQLKTQLGNFDAGTGLVNSGALTGQGEMAAMAVCWNISILTGMTAHFESILLGAGYPLNVIQKIKTQTACFG